MQDYRFLKLKKLSSQKCKVKRVVIFIPNYSNLTTTISELSEGMVSDSVSYYFKTTNVLKVKEASQDSGEHDFY